MTRLPYLLHDLFHRVIVALHAHAERGAFGDDVGLVALRRIGVGHLLHDVAAMVAVFVAGAETHVGAEQAVEEIVAFHRRLLADAQQHGRLEAQVRGHRHRGAAMVRLDAAAGNQQIAALFQGFLHGELQLADLVARPFAAGLVVAFDIDILPAFLRPAGKSLNLRGKIRQGQFLHIIFAFWTNTFLQIYVNL